jgi:ferredoxin-NADP reductase
MLDRSGFTRVVLISAGVGATPLLAMLKAHAERGAAAPPLLWLHVARNIASEIHRTEVDEILASNAGFRRLVFHTDPGKRERQGHDYDQPGRPDRATFTSLTTEEYTLSPMGRCFTLQGVHSDFYICGPDTFQAAVREALRGAGVAAASLRSERFAPARTAQGQPAIANATVSLARSGRTLTWGETPDQTLLELMEAHGLRPEHGCRMGTCGSCETGLLAGSVCYDNDPAYQPAAGRILPCCSRPASAMLRLDA